MELDRLMQRYFRLRQELSIAYKARPWESGRIDRLANDLSAAEREIAAKRPHYRHAAPQVAISTSATA